MSSRGQKRNETVNGLPADKRACSSLEFRPSSSNSSAQTLTSTAQEAQDADMDTSSSTSGSTRSEGDGEKESAYGSCDSDNSIHDYYRNRSLSDQTKFRKVLTSLSEEVEESEQLAQLTELCELLSFCSDSSLSSPMVDSFSPVLVRLATHDSNPDIMLLAIRAITYLCDVNPRSSSFVVRHDAIPVLCQRLMAIEYLDVAEQCLQALEKISREQPLACLQSGAIMAVLGYIDFFSTSIQRVALSTVVNICKKLSSESPSLFMEAVPILCNLLQYEDIQLVESVVTCLIKIGEQVSSSTDMLDEICKHGLLQHALHLLGLNGRTTLCQPTYIGLIGLLAKLATGSTVAFRSLFELNISSIIKDMLSTYDLVHGMQPMVDGHQSQITEVLKLLNELLPTISEDGCHQKSEKEAFLLNHPDILHKFGVDLLPMLIQVVNSGVNQFICYGCLSVISKLVHFGKSDTLHSLLQSANFSSFLAGMFARKEKHVVLLALQIVDTTMIKLPHLYLNSFIKEGVLFAIYGLLSPDNDLNVSTVSDGIATRDAHRCLCFAFHTGLSSKSPENGTCKIQSDTVQNLAKHIWVTHFETESVNPEKGVTDILQKLRALSTALTDLVNKSVEDATSSQWEEDIFNLLLQIISELNEKDSISTFEFVESGIIKAFVDYLSSAIDLVGREDYATKYSCIMEKRFEVFGRLLLTRADPAQAEYPLLTLVRRLQSALSSVESFPIVSNQTYKRRNSYATIPYGRCTSYPCLKVQFVRENGEIYLQGYVEDVVNVDPFVPLDEIEGYLLPRVRNNGTKNLKMDSKDLKEKNSSCSHSPSDSSTSQIRSADIVLGTEMLVDVQKLQEGKQNLVFSSPLDTARFPEIAVDSADIVDVETDHATEEENNPVQEGDRANMDDEHSSAKLLFYLEGQQLNRELTLYQSILEQQTEAGRNNIPSASLWSRIYKITYGRDATTNPSYVRHSHDEDVSSPLSQRTSFFQSPCFTCMFGSEILLGKSGPTYDMLSLLKRMEGINELRFHLMYRARVSEFVRGANDNFDELNAAVDEVPQNEFVNKKLTEKLEQQMRDPMAVSVGALPAWCSQLIARCPFLFSFEARLKYFNLVALGRLPHATSVSHLDVGGSSGRQQNNGIIHRKKILVHRNKILESARQMMELHARQKVILEVEYSEEVGTGLGPTLEFYTLVCQEFQRIGLCMWRDECVPLHSSTTSKAEDSGVSAPFGLFPRPWSLSSTAETSNMYSEVIGKFSLLGQTVAKALQDGRVLDLPFSKAFYKLILGKELDLYDIQSFDPALGRTLLEFQALVERKNYLMSISEERSQDLNVCLRSTKIEDLCLDFTVPGYPDYALVSEPESESKMVNLYNLEEYVKFIVDATIKSGISRQVDAFKSGFDQVFPIRHLSVFTEEELERLLCGEHVLWNPDELLEHIKFDHGYTVSSSPIVNLLEIMLEFDLKQQRAFLQFVTGAPRLPNGGLASLNPKLTIVRKVVTPEHCSKGIDDDLPSVMTCANYLKLPPYSSKEIMKEKVLYAITEGQGSFHLS